MSLRILAASASLAFLATGCISTSRHETEMASLRGEMGTAAKKCSADLDATKRACADEAATADAASKASLQKLGDERDVTRKALDECTNKGGDSAKKFATCQIERDEAKQRLARVESSINKVRDALKVMSDAGKLQVKVQRGFLVIALQGDILFDSGKSKLKDEAKPILGELAGVLKSLPDRLFQVAGHTDNTGAEDLNWDLSMQRALTVVKFLIKDGGVDGKNLSAGGYAMYQPVTDNGTDEGKRGNRRVEFLLIPNLSEILNVQPK
jgi:chemotaxis protein MotB